jgi:TPR repeat protein
MKSSPTLPVLFVGVLLTSNLLAEAPEKTVAAANSGDANAMFDVGSIALLEHDYPKAFKWLSKGAEAKHAPSEAGLGFMYFNGFACDKDITKARKLYEQSAANGAHQGYNNLAHLYRYGLGGLEKDVPKAVELLEKAARLGNEFAVNSLAKIYMGDELGAPDTVKILQWLRFGADRNYRGCLSDLGYAYQHGIGVEKDIKKAITLYQKSIDQGSAGARSNLGYLYLMGEDVAKDYPRAMKLFQAATDENDIGGTINLAVMRFNGLGCDRDPNAAFSLLEKAVELGSGQAKNLLKDWKAKEFERKK